MKRFRFHAMFIVILFVSSGSYYGTLPTVTSPEVQEFKIDLSTYFGGSGNDEPRHVTTDVDGNTVILGETTSPDFPLVEANQTEYMGARDLVLMKFSASLGTILFSTLFGGSGEDIASGVGIDSNGNIVITGATGSLDFPVLNAIQSNYTGGVFDAYVAKFNPLGELVFSTYLGGSDSDWAYGVAFDESDNIIFTGHMTSDDYPTVDPMRPFSGGEEAVVTKLSSDGQTILFSTYLGGSEDDFGIDIAVDTNGDIIVAGLTFSEDWPTLNAHQESLGGSIDGFISKISADGQSLLFSTYFGGMGQDGFWDVTLESSDNIVASGRAGSADFPVTQEFNETYGGLQDGSLVKFNSTGELLFSRCIGGSSNEIAWDVAILNNGTYAVVGETHSNDFPTVVPIQENRTGSQEAFAAVTDDLGYLLFSTYIGGERSDLGFNCAERATGGFIMTGSTSSDDIFLVEPIQENRTGSSDFLLIEFSPWTSEGATQHPDSIPLLLTAGVGMTLIVIVLIALRRRK
ncbi:MAG: SBBP repeat-containing protein [Candidatus Thorarchaeota archaeon]